MSRNRLKALSRLIRSNARLRLIGNSLTAIALMISMLGIYVLDSQMALFGGMVSAGTISQFLIGKDWQAY
ncbi:MAG: hypothetical protein RKH07_12600 [Gammaproteobacteria bacterium]